MIETHLHLKLCKIQSHDDKLDKLECRGRPKLDAGTEARNLSKEYKGKKLSDGKGIMRADRLTNKAVNTLQNYYGMAMYTTRIQLNGMICMS